MKTGSSRALPLKRGAHLIRRLRIVGKDGATPFARGYCSTGGGGFEWKDQPTPTRGNPLQPIGSVVEFLRLAQESNRILRGIMVENEKGADLLKRRLRSYFRVGRLVGAASSRDKASGAMRFL
jgi:hypothetical protein